MICSLVVQDAILKEENRQLSCSIGILQSMDNPANNVSTTKCLMQEGHAIQVTRKAWLVTFRLKQLFYAAHDRCKF
uniref:Uncharacterized protein n=1 Tax=Romanomermis culicivorax TaxID=13658 RepID=A0A915IZJ4_ROMCU